MKELSDKQKGEFYYSFFCLNQTKPVALPFSFLHSLIKACHLICFCCIATVRVNVPAAQRFITHALNEVDTKSQPSSSSSSSSSSQQKKEHISKSHDSKHHHESPSQDKHSKSHSSSSSHKRPAPQKENSNNINSSGDKKRRL